ncbi:hypothetical protein CPB86DRAFT_413539 [Serendipita vermifera]|nr:hypothetical protein CPB86DRAFT_413539 [Serendipita vermifera]
MPPDATEENINPSAKLFGLGREPKRPGDPLVVKDKTTVWEIYNHKAWEVDREMIKDWNDSLNTLLIFTALYSAVLTAFIIESMKLLEEDPAETMRDILLIVSRQLANSSFPAFEPIAYETPKYAIIVNSLLFTSLSCALIAALLAVLALQWVANYDMELNTSSPEKRALQRHMRLMGIRKWKMSELIASLPLLIFVALFLFFIGIADWLWHMNREISGIVMGGIGIGFLLYTITNLIGMVSVDAPFRTPISKEIPGITQRVIGWPRRAIYNLLSTLGRARGRWSRWVIDSLPTALGSAIRSRRDAVHTAQQQLAFTKREEKFFYGKGKDPIALDGLVWLANRVEISPASRDTWIILIKGLTEVPTSLLIDEEKIKDVPWKAIFEMLCSLYIGKREYSADELERAMWICKGMGIIPYLNSPTCRRFLRDLRQSEGRSTPGMVYFASCTQDNRYEYHLKYREWIGLAFEYTKESISQIGYHYLHFMLLNAKNAWSYMEIWQRTRLVTSMTRAWAIPSIAIREGSSSVSLPTHSIELILDFIIPRVDVNTIDARYIAASRSSDGYWDEAWNEALCLVLQVMTQHLILQISHKFDSLSDFTHELKLFSRFMDAKRPDLVKEKDNFIWIMLNKVRDDISFDMDRICDALCEGLYSRPFRLAWADLFLALDAFVTRRSPHLHLYSKTIRFIEYWLRFSGYDGDNVTLAQVRDPCIAWIISWYCPNDIQFQALIHPNFSEWSPIMEQAFIRIFIPRSPIERTILDSDARISFLRALILDGPSNARIEALVSLSQYMWWSFFDEKWHRLFASPVLSVILEQSIKSEEIHIRRLLTLMADSRWFYDEFSQANGLDWLPLIAFNAIHTEDQALRDNVLTEILFDQILYSTASRDVHAPLSSSYHYLQSIGQSHNPQDHHGLANLRAALVWVFKNSTRVHDSQDRAQESSPLVFDPPVLERKDWPEVGDVRSFDFVKDMSGEEWEDWATRLKVMIMGVSLGGLKPGPFQDRNRFYRDPDGFCGRI